MASDLSRDSRALPVVFGRLVINSFFSAFNESRLRFKWVKPASFNLYSLRGSRLPLVVMPTWGKRFRISATMSMMSLLTKGSPPVNRTLRTPTDLKASAKRLT